MLEILLQPINLYAPSASSKRNTLYPEKPTHKNCRLIFQAGMVWSDDYPSRLYVDTQQNHPLLHFSCLTITSAEYLLYSSGNASMVRQLAAELVHEQSFAHHFVPPHLSHLALHMDCRGKILNKSNYHGVSHCLLTNLIKISFSCVKLPRSLNPKS